MRTAHRRRSEQSRQDPPRTTVRHHFRQWQEYTKDSGQGGEMSTDCSKAAVRQALFGDWSRQPAPTYNQRALSLRRCMPMPTDHQPNQNLRCTLSFGQVRGSTHSSRWTAFLEARPPHIARLVVIGRNSLKFATSRACIPSLESSMPSTRPAPDVKRLGVDLGSTRELVYTSRRSKAYTSPTVKQECTRS